MKEKLTRSIGLKVLSIFLGFSLWLLVANEANPKIRDDKEVPITVVNGDVLTSAGKTFEIMGKSTVTVNYDIYVLDQYKISASDFRAYIDLADLYEPTGAVPVKVEVAGNRNLIMADGISTSPEVIRVQIEDLQRKRFELMPVVKGTAADGYEVGTATLSPSYVYVSGPTSMVGQISKVGIEIMADGADSDINGTASPKFYDANDTELTEFGDRVEVNIDSIDFELSILKVKNVNIDFEVMGQVADGYRYTGIECDTRTIPIEGMKSVLASIGTITIPGSDVNIDGLSADKTLVLDMNQYLPPGVEIAGEDNAVITVTLKVEPLEVREFILEPSDIVQTGVSNKYNYKYSEDSVTVYVEGLAEDLDALSERRLRPVIDFTGLEPGEHTGSLIFDLGEGFEVLDYTEFTITVSEKGAETAGMITEPSSSGSEGEKETDAG